MAGFARSVCVVVNRGPSIRRRVAWSFTHTYGFQPQNGAPMYSLILVPAYLCLKIFLIEHGKARQLFLILEG